MAPPIASKKQSRSAQNVISKQLAITGSKQLQSAATLSREWTTKTLTSADPQVVANGLALLGQIGESIVWQLDCTGQIVNLLGHTNSEVAMQAAKTLGMLGTLGLSYLDKIADMLKSQSGSQQAAAATVLGKLGASAAKCTSLLAQVASGGATVQAKAAATYALGFLGAKSQEQLLLRLLEASEPEVVGAACTALGQCGFANHSSAIAAKLSVQGAKVGALGGLAALGPQATGAGSLVSVLTDSAAEVRVAAVDAVRAGVVLAPENLATALTSATGSSQKCALVLALGALGPKASSQAAAVEALLGDGSEESLPVVAGGLSRGPAEMRKPRCATLIALAQMKAGKAMSCAEEALDMDDWEVRLCALEALKLLADKNSNMDLPGQVQVMLTSDIAYPVRAKAAEVLGAWRMEDASSTLAEAMADDKAPSVKAAAATALAQLSPSVSSAQEVFKLLEDSHASVRVAALQALPKSGYGEWYTGVIVTYLEDADHTVRAAAINALGQMAASSKPYIPELKDRLADPSVEVRLAAKSALLALGVEDAEVVEPTEVGAAGEPGAKMLLADGSVDLEFSNLADFYKFSMEKLQEMEAQG